MAVQTNETEYLFITQSSKQNTNVLFNEHCHCNITEMLFNSAFVELKGPKGDSGINGKQGLPGLPGLSGEKGEKVSGSNKLISN